MPVGLYAPLYAPLGSMVTFSLDPPSIMASDVVDLGLSVAGEGRA
jgi:hypothetical protein